MIAARSAGPGRGPALVGAVACAALARTLIGGATAAASIPAAAAFCAVLGVAVVAGGGRFGRPSWGNVGVGVGGGAALVALSLVGVTAVVGARAPAATLAWWVPLVSVVAAMEELVFRGVLFTALQARSGDLLAVGMTALLFAAIHLPLYGAGALGLDLCVGVFLGCLRVVTGSVTAPLVAHVLADVATGWLG